MQHDDHGKGKNNTIYLKYAITMMTEKIEKD